MLNLVKSRKIGKERHDFQKYEKTATEEETEWIVLFQRADLGPVNQYHLGLKRFLVISVIPITEEFAFKVWEGLTFSGKKNSISMKLLNKCLALTIVDSITANTPP